MATIRNHSGTAIKSVLDVVTVSAGTIASIINSGGVIATAVEDKATAFATGISHKAKLDAGFSKKKAEETFKVEYSEFMKEMEGRVTDKDYYDEAAALVEELLS